MSEIIVKDIKAYKSVEQDGYRALGNATECDTNYYDVDKNLVCAENDNARDKYDLRSMTLDEMTELIVSLGEKKFRAKQLFNWVSKGVTDFDDMGNIPKSFRGKLAGVACVNAPEILCHQVSKLDGTEKYLFDFASIPLISEGVADPGYSTTCAEVDRSDTNTSARHDTAESVLMRYDYGNSACVSTQVGCNMRCIFCASGINGKVRDLTAGEIVSQVLGIMGASSKRRSDDTGAREGCVDATKQARGKHVKVNHVVFMGTGEPFDNYDEVAKAIRILHDPEGLGISMRNMTVSTCGIVPGINNFATDFPETNLAISLHAPDDEIRRKLMPIANKYRIGEIMAACDAYTEKTHRRVTYEYALIKGVNDSDEVIKELAELLRGRLAHVNLIPLNRVNTATSDSGSVVTDSEAGKTTIPLTPTSRKRANEIKKYLETNGIPTTVRRSLGADIDGACGQLRNRAAGV